MRSASFLTGILMTYQDMMNKNFSRQRKQMTAEFLKDQNSLPEKLPLYLIQNIELVVEMQFSEILG